MEIKNYMLRNIILILIMIILQIIILSCGSYNSKFYKFLKLYLSNNDISDENINNLSSEYENYLKFYQNNSSIYQININATILYKSNYSCFKTLGNLQFFIYICLLFFNIFIGIYIY